MLGLAVALLANDGAASAGADPIPDSRAVVRSGDARFTVLTPWLFRMEWSPDGKFEDRASLAFINRKLPVPKFKVEHEGGWLIIRTEGLTLRYKENSGGFTETNLSIELRVGDQSIRWHPAMQDTGNLLGTARTLDSVSGGCVLEPGLLSRDGWVVVDDSKRPVFEPGGPDDLAWCAPRRRWDAIDWYFFGYGHEYKRALADFIKVAGRIPLPPRFVFGSWWSRYWAYSDAELRELVKEFREHDVPLDVLVIDMDWHLDGWTGYTWNPKYFPDPEGFLKWVHEQGLRATLNLHPADGVGKQEKQFAAVAKRMGVDPKKVEKIPFDSTDRKFIDAYFADLHHPLERQGVDFWWIDWQQGEDTKIENLDPLFWLNYLHTMDIVRNPENKGRRPLIFSRWGGLGNHRYQIGFSGDTYCNWPSLAFQPYFTSTAGNVGYAYWSHDIGGHQPGKVDPELYARWIQWGIFSPVLRTHTTKNPLAERRIWKFPAPVFKAARAAFHLRYELIPYIYSAARECYDTGLPLCRPLYYEWPDLEEAYARGDEYLFGEQMLVKPVTAPMDPDIGATSVNVWIPPGRWTDWFTGKTYAGPTTANLLVPLDQIPLFARAGAMIPSAAVARNTREQRRDELILDVFPGQRGQARLYDDDGETLGYEKDERTLTPVTYDGSGGQHRVRIGRVNGKYPGMPTERRIGVRLRGVWPAEGVTVGGKAISAAKGADEDGYSYDSKTLSVVVRLAKGPIDRPVEILIRTVGRAGDEQLISDGLRGALDNFEMVGATLGAGAPIPIQRAMTVRDDLITNPARAIETARFLRDNLRAISVETARAERDAGKLRPLLARLLGLTRRLTVEQAGRPDAVVVTTQIMSSPPYGTTAGLAASLEMDELNGKPALGSGKWLGMSVGQPLDVPVRMELGGSAKTQVLRGTLRLKLDEFVVEFPIERTLLPSINAWWVVGPFETTMAAALKTKFEPEKKIDLKAKYKGKGGRTIGWQRVARRVGPKDDLTDEFRVDFHDLYKERVFESAAYGLTYLISPRDMKASLAIGSDDGCVVWLNGKEVHRIDRGRAYGSKEDRVPIELKKGTNTLLVKVSQGGGDWSFGVHVETPDGKPLPEVEARLEPAE